MADSHSLAISLTATPELVVLLKYWTCSLLYSKIFKRSTALLVSLCPEETAAAALGIAVAAAVSTHRQSYQQQAGHQQHHEPGVSAPCQQRSFSTEMSDAPTETYRHSAAGVALQTLCAVPAYAPAAGQHSCLPRHSSGTPRQEKTSVARIEEASHRTDSDDSSSDSDAAEHEQVPIAAVTLTSEVPLCPCC